MRPKGDIIVGTQTFPIGFYVVIWIVSGIVFGFISAAVAHAKGRRGVGAAFVIGFFLGIIGLIIVALLPVEESDKTKKVPGRTQAGFLNMANPRVPEIERGFLSISSAGISFQPMGKNVWAIEPNTIQTMKVFDKNSLPAKVPLGDRLVPSGRAALFVGAADASGRTGSYYFTANKSRLVSMAQGYAQGPQQVATRPCPYCAEPIRVEAIKCKHCGSDVAFARPVSSPLQTPVAQPIPRPAPQPVEPPAPADSSSVTNPPPLATAVQPPPPSVPETQRPQPGAWK